MTEDVDPLRETVAHACTGDAAAVEELVKAVENQVYALARRLAGQGVGIIFVSSELEEVLEVSDRVLVLNQGRVYAELAAHDASLENVLALAMAKG